MRYEFHPEAEQEFIVLAVPSVLSVLSVLSKLSEESFCPGFGRQPYWLWRRKLEEVIGGPGSRATSFVPWARIRAATVKERPPNFSSATQLRSAHPTVWGGRRWDLPCESKVEVVYSGGHAGNHDGIPDHHRRMGRPRKFHVIFSTGVIYGRTTNRAASRRFPGDRNRAVRRCVCRGSQSL